MLLSSTPLAFVLLFLSISVLQLVYAGNPIPVFDDYILCVGDPPAFPASWPPGRSQASYNTNTALCSAVHGLAYNLGCICAGPNERPICSLANGADVVLFTHQLSGYSYFREWCMGRCSCLDEESAEAWRVQSAAQQARAEEEAVNPFAGGAGGVGRGVGVIPGASGLAALAGGVSGNSPTAGGGAGSTLTNTANASCEGKCTSVGANCTDQCACQVASSMYDPQSGRVLYTAACTLPLSLFEAGGGGRRKRSVREAQMPACPCNASYVSHQCCLSKGGMVWEGPECKLGELAKVDEL